MSKANSPIKVLLTAIKRVDKGWTKNTWHYHNPEDGINYVCFEGAIYGYCDSTKHNVTPAQAEAARVCKEIIFERTGAESIPHFNDRVAETKEDIKEIMKLAIIRLETSDPDDDLDDELLDFVQPNGG